jgi:RimJ/RimL family protein N-acetyltransferase
MKAGQIIYQTKTKNGEKIIVRYPLKTDLKALLTYINTLSKEKTFIRFQGEQLSLKEEKKYLNSLMIKIKKGQAVKLLVFGENRLIGGSDIEMMDKISSHVGLLGITIAKDYRHQGLGKLLISLVLTEAKKNLPSLRIIILECFGNNQLALKMYQKFGFKEYGRLPEGISHRGIYVDCLHLYKKI